MPPKELPPKELSSERGERTVGGTGKGLWRTIFQKNHIRLSALDKRP